MPAEDSSDRNAYVHVSPRDRRYFELSDGSAYVPIGLNMPHPPRDGSGLAGMDEAFGRLAANGGNFARIWLSHKFYDVEHEASGVYDEGKAGRIDELLELAREHGIRLKLCIEHFRHLGEAWKNWNEKRIHHVSRGGPAATMAGFIDGVGGRETYLRKLDWLAGRYGSDPVVFGWELWNEVDAVWGGDFMAWTEAMLPELHRRFPDNLCMQSLGSFDHAWKRPMYRRMVTMDGNDVAQVHRYLDLGAGLDVCRGPVDVLAADAVREVLAAGPGRPTLLAESGAVQPKHTGPFEHYAADTEGIILHDVLFAPFFAGAAGCGHNWHWDRYVRANDLWHQFGRFAEAIRGVDPPAEAFEPAELAHDRLRVYALKGKRTLLAWCRDSENTWMSELRDARPPETLEGVTADLSREASLDGATVRAYDPWQDTWTECPAREGKVSLPSFRRSVVLRAERAS